MTLTKLALYTSIRAAPSSTLPNSTHYSHNRRIMGTSSSSSISLPSSSYAQPLPSVRSSPRFIEPPETFRRPMRFSLEIFLSLVTVMAHPTSIFLYFPSSYGGSHHMRRNRQAGFTLSSVAQSDIRCIHLRGPFIHRFPLDHAQARRHGRYRMAATPEPIFLHKDVVRAEKICRAHFQCT
ncbi:hypothetical protein EI94DRAFT_733068 [Lactarius quietus]|nr:hypothetical protein EI94DRAFT_733068 [Lactarius quietus]